MITAILSQRFTSFIRLYISLVATGSRPVTGSSRSKSFGLVASALELDKRKSFPCIILGIIMASIIMMIFFRFLEIS